jgi:hypothetical protein
MVSSRQGACMVSTSNAADATTSSSKQHPGCVSTMDV